MKNKISYHIITQRSHSLAELSTLLYKYNSVESSSFRTYYNIINTIILSLNSTNKYYPYFDKWLEKAIFDMPLGKRTLIYATYSEMLVGVSILKHTESKNKLCTYWVHQNFRRERIGTSMLYLIYSILVNRNVLVSIPEFSIKYFKFLIDKNIFMPFGQRDSLYSHNISEHFFTFFTNRELMKYFFQERIPDVHSEVDNFAER